MKKIYAFVYGGLGNQMFQYLYALNVSERYMSGLSVIDTTAAARVKRGWQLGVFGVQPDNTSLFKTHMIKVFYFILRLLQKVSSRAPVLAIGDSNSLKIKGLPLILNGYFQDLKIINHVRAKEIFSFPEIQERQGIPFSSGVAIHVRRGDYVFDPIAQKTHYICDVSYYERAWTNIKNLCGDNIAAYVFSDDPEWVKSNINLDGNVTYFNSTGMPEWYDMASMAKCKHFIISNSSYSWWAAFLSYSVDKIVICPEYWKVGVPTNTLPLYDKSWVLI